MEREKVREEFRKVSVRCLKCSTQYKTNLDVDVFKCNNCGSVVNVKKSVVVESERKVN
jgi:DNA-directed RNA polymerase subunit RPC12/RpoP